MMSPEQIQQWGGWFSAGCLLIGAGIKAYFDFKKKQSETDSSIAIARENKEKLDREEILEQYHDVKNELSEALIKIDMLTEKITKISAQMSLIYPIIKKAVNDNPEVKEAVEIAFESFKNDKKEKL